MDTMTTFFADLQFMKCFGTLIQGFGGRNNCDVRIEDESFGGRRSAFDHTDDFHW